MERQFISESLKIKEKLIIKISEIYEECFRLFPEAFTRSLQKYFSDLR